MQDSVSGPSPTMRQIAERAGVNRSTVSLALRNDRRLKVDTREKIQAIAAEMGYCRNPTVAELMTQLRAGQQKHFRYNIAVLNFGPTAVIDTKVYEGFEKRAKMLGYGLDLLHVPNISPQRLEQILVNRGIRGILLLTLWGEPKLADDFRNMWSKFASCSVGVHPNNPDLPFVSDDNYFTAFTVVNKVCPFGFSRIGLALEAAVNIETEYRFIGGYLAGCQANPSLQQVPLLLLRKSGRDQFLSWFRRFKPDVIVCIQEEILGWLNEAGYIVPRDVSLVHLDLDATHGGWAGMRQDRVGRGVCAVDMIVSQINNNEMGPPDSPIAMLTESIWESGSTLTAPNKAVARRNRTLRPFQRKQDKQKPESKSPRSSLHQ